MSCAECRGAEVVFRLVDDCLRRARRLYRDIGHGNSDEVANIEAARRLIAEWQQRNEVGP